VEHQAKVGLSLGLGLVGFSVLLWGDVPECLSVECLSVYFIGVAGSTLVKCGQTQQKLGQAKRDLMQATTNSFLQQLKTFLDTDVKSIQVTVFRFLLE